MGLAAVFVGALIAFAIAVAILYGTVVGLTRGGRFLWRALVQEEGEKAAGGDGLREIPCWKEKECPPSAREMCPAYRRRAEQLPCWLANLQGEGRLRVSCLTCHRFNVAQLVA